MGGAWGAAVGGSNIPPPILDPLEAMILDPWDPLVGMMMMMMVMIILKTLVPTYLVQIICPGITF